MWLTGPSKADRDLAARLLTQAAELQRLAMHLLRLGSASTSSPPSTASSSPTSRPRIRGAESVTVLDRETRLKQDLEAQRTLNHPPEPSIGTAPGPSGEPPGASQD